MKFINPLRLLRRGGSWKRFRAIVLFRTYANISSSKQNSYGGFLWYLIAPAIAAASYLAVGHFIKHRENNFAAFVICGSVAWQFFASGVTNMSDSILKAKAVVKQINIPKIIFPMDTLLSEFIEYLFALVVLIVGLLCLGFRPGWTILALPFYVALHILLVIGVGLPLAALVPFYNDIRDGLRSIMRLLSLLSGIFFSSSAMSGTSRFYFYLNPAAHVLDWYRAALLYHTWPSPGSLVYVTLWGILGTWLGTTIIHRRDHLYAKELHE